MHVKHFSPSDGPALDDVDGLTVLQALSDPVRLEIVRQLATCGGPGELNCGKIEVPVTKSTASHHFKVLRLAGVIEQHDEGSRRISRLRRDDLERRYPGLLESVLRAAQAEA